MHVGVSISMSMCTYRHNVYVCPCGCKHIYTGIHKHMTSVHVYMCTWMCVYNSIKGVAKQNSDVEKKF